MRSHAVTGVEKFAISIRRLSSTFPSLLCRQFVCLDFYFCSSSPIIVFFCRSFFLVTALEPEVKESVRGRANRGAQTRDRDPRELPRSVLQSEASDEGSSVSAAVSSSSCRASEGNSRPRGRRGCLAPARRPREIGRAPGRADTRQRRDSRAPARLRYGLLASRRSSVKMSGGIPVLLITANVGSIFEEVISLNFEF